jgi:anti-sigma regulatory factor (Ser/Thr protein kinase)
MTDGPGVRLRAEGPDTAALHGMPGTALAELAVSLSLDPEPAQVARARELAAKVLADCGRAEHAWLAELIVSELATNAIVHGSGPVSVGLSCRSDSVRVEVHDQHPGRPVRRRPSAQDEAGRGLALIDGLIGLYGGEFGTTADSGGPGKSVYVTVRFPQDKADVR